MKKVENANRADQYRTMLESKGTNLRQEHSPKTCRQKAKNHISQNDITHGTQINVHNILIPQL